MFDITSVPGWTAMSAEAHHELMQDRGTWPRQRFFLGWLATALIGFVHTGGRLNRQALGG